MSEPFRPQAAYQFRFTKGDDAAKALFVRPLIQKLSGEQNHRCAYCGVEMIFDLFSPQTATADHITPRVDGGTFYWTNIVAACWRCNFARGTKDALEFFEWITKLKVDGHSLPQANPQSMNGMRRYLKRERRRAIKRKSWQHAAELSERIRTMEDKHGKE